MINPGQFDKKIHLLKRTIIKDELYQDIESFQSYATVWSMVRTIKSSEAIKAGNLSSLKEIRFVMRYSKKLAQLIDADLTHFKIELRGQQYEVKSVVNDDEANLTITIVAERTD